MIPRFLFALILFVTAFPAAANDCTDTGPLSLLVTYRCDPADRPAFRTYMETKAAEQFEAWKAEGVFRDYRIFFNWYVDDKTWDATVMIRFAKWADVALWNAIVRKRPGGLCKEGLALAKPMVTTSADVVWQNPGDAARTGDRSESVFLLIPYKYVAGASVYREYAGVYVIPQLDGWVKEGALRSYKVLMNRFSTGDRWGSLLLLEYASLEEFGKRALVKEKVRVGLRKVPEWSAYHARKQSIRKEQEPIIADLIAPR